MGGRDLKEPFLSVYGHVTLDQILTVRKFPDPNTSEDVLTKGSSLGGTGPNIAVCAAKLGCPTAICAFVGKDFPHHHREFMESSGLLMDELITVDGYETSTAIVVNDPGLTQKVLFYQGPQGCASELGISLVKNARHSQHVHFCTGEPRYYTDVMRQLGPAVCKAIDPAQESHRIWNVENFNEALPMADALFCNNYEAESLRRYAGKDSIFDCEVRMVVCTMGAEGSRARIGDEIIDIPVVKSGKVVDATGCGDSYRAGFYTGLYRGYTIPDSLVLASAVASFVIERTGALTNIPSWEDVVERAEPYFGQVHRSDAVRSDRDAGNRQVDPVRGAAAPRVRSGGRQGVHP